MTTTIEEACKMADTYLAERGLNAATPEHLSQVILAAIELGERREREAVKALLASSSADNVNYYARLIERGDHHPAAVEAINEKERM